MRGDALDGRTAGDVFYTEALRLLNLGRTYTLPTIQALGLLSIREASCGLDSDSWFHSGQSIRMACEMGLHRVRCKLLLFSPSIKCHLKLSCLECCIKKRLLLSEYHRNTVL